MEFSLLVHIISALTAATLVAAGYTPLSFSLRRLSLQTSALRVCLYRYHAALIATAFIARLLSLLPASLLPNSELYVTAANKLCCLSFLRLSLPRLSLMCFYFFVIAAAPIAVDFIYTVIISAGIAAAL